LGNLTDAISNRILYVISLNHFINDGSTYLIASLFPIMIVHFGFSSIQIGILVAVGYLVNLIFQPLTGRYSERFEARKLLALGISLIAFSMILFTVSNSFAFMIISVLILRFGSSFFHPVGVSVISRTYHGNRVDNSMGFQSAFGNLGIVFAFVFSAPVYLALGWRGPFLIYVALEIGTVLITLVTLREKATNQTDSAGEIENGKSAKETSYNGKRSPWLGLPFFFIMAAFITGGSYAIFGSFGNVFLFRIGFGLSLSNYLMAIWVVSAFIGAILTGRLTRRFTRYRLFYFSYSIAGLAALLFAFSGRNIFLALVGLLVNGFTLSITYPATYSELSDFLGEKSKSKGEAFGILFSSQIAGSSILGLLGGYIGALISLPFVFGIAAALLLASVPLVFLWSRIRSKFHEVVQPP
jgi:FSR family fosmidomycin resistance protein-like MFS transporter